MINIGRDIAYFSLIISCFCVGLFHQAGFMSGVELSLSLSLSGRMSCLGLGLFHQAGCMSFVLFCLGLFHQAV